tara:strand:- start:28022 stop:28123 length:102 start_codon:yes stop_codon:yes gene_type:complete
MVEIGVWGMAYTAALRPRVLLLKLFAQNQMEFG